MLYTKNFVCTCTAHNVEAFEIKQNIIKVCIIIISNQIITKGANRTYKLQKKIETNLITFALNLNSRHINKFASRKSLNTQKIISQTYNTNVYKKTDCFQLKHFICYGLETEISIQM